MIALLIAFVFVGLFIAIVCAAMAAFLAWLGSLVMPKGSERVNSQVSAAVLPLLLGGWIIVSIYDAASEPLNGPDVQGVAGMTVIAFVTICVAWPAGFFAARKVLSRPVQ